ncbi:MAG: cell wall-binding protein, partial [Lachnospiraceae bacterium]|nr:cell wall-binding protein [Lachnospiraceae bacterium]
RCAQEGKYMKVRFNDKTYLFNEFGYAVYGIHVVNNEYYYFGSGVSDCSMKTGLLNYDVDGTNDGASFFFQDDGIGLSGVKNNKLYYKGKLQMASSEQKYAAFKVNNLIYLVNSSGSIMKNKKKVTDGDGCKWSTNSGGVVTYKEEGADYTEAAPPELSNDY